MSTAKLYTDSNATNAAGNTVADMTTGTEAVKVAKVDLYNGDGTVAFKKGAEMTAAQFGNYDYKVLYNSYFGQ
ncbi:MAG: hypothetical protein V8S42_04865 [Lachnospiraceae bacterium]